MSTQSSILAAVAGAAIASAGWYFAGSGAKASAQTETSSPPLSATLTTKQPCPATQSHAIPFAQAQQFVTDYIDPNNSYRLTSDGSNTMKGFFIDRCIVEELFEMYPNSDGLQFYIGLKNVGSGTVKNNIIWMASQLTSGDATPLRENCVTLPNSVQDLVNACPSFCPQKNDLP
jgi:hypothetical protein